VLPQDRATQLANYRTLLRSFPAIADYFRHARWVRRGDGLCYLNICYPEADTRTLFASLVRSLRAARGRLSHVILVSGGDFTRWCFHVRADPLFGSPMLPMPGEIPPAGPIETEFANLLHFNFFWTRLCKEAAASAGAQFLLADDVTFFEKSGPDAIERAAALGVIAGEGQQIRFSSHRRLALTFQAERRRFAASEGIAMGPFPHADELLYIDEYHYRAESQARIAQTLLGAWG
jgi:hypothetical protein